MTKVEAIAGAAPTGRNGTFLAQIALREAGPQRLYLLGKCVGDEIER
jgi:hypothetical protein